MVFGALLGVLVDGAIWVYQHPGPQAPMRYLESVDFTRDAGAWWLVAGAVAGYLVSGVFGGVERARRLAGKVVSLTVMAFGACLGVLVGLLLYLLLWVSNNPEAGFIQGAAYLPLAFEDSNDPIRAFIAAGALTGALVAAYARSGDLIRRATQLVTGAVIGGLAGLVLYAFAYVLVNYPLTLDTSSYLVHIAEAIYSGTVIEFAFAAMGASVGVLMSRYSWRLYGIFTLTALISVIFGFLLYSAFVTMPLVPPERRWFSLFLFVAEAASLTMVLLYSFYTLDVATRKRWTRAPRNALFSVYYLPRVAFHVPTFNEPPELVVQTLKGLLSVDYPEDRFHIWVLDDSTRPECAKPLEAFCKRYGITYLQRPERVGFKAGALNWGLKHTPPDVDLIAVIDADYVIEPEYLRETVGYFIDTGLAWIQTPQDYSNENQSFLTKQYYLADKYFYRTVLPSRNEENSIIFCGTMGILRRQALVAAGGWGEKYITEDSELSVRLLAHGWRSLYVNKTYGRGLIPPTYEGYKKQHYRWAFGGGQVLRGHFWSIFFGRLSSRQRLDYLIGNIHWFEGLFILAIGFAVLGMAWGDLVGAPVLTHHANEVLLLGLVPWFLLVDGFTRLHMVLRRHLNLTFGGTLRVLGMWFAVKFSNCFAALKGFVGFRIPFVRTPKAPTHRLSAGEAIRRAVQLTQLESAMAAILWITCFLLGIHLFTGAHDTGSIVITRGLLCLWLVYYALIFTAAPTYAYKSYTTFNAPPEAPAPAPAAAGVAQ